MLKTMFKEIKLWTVAAGTCSTYLACVKSFQFIKFCFLVFRLVKFVRFYPLLQWWTLISFNKMFSLPLSFLSKYFSFFLKSKSCRWLLWSSVESNESRIVAIEIFPLPIFLIYSSRHDGKTDHSIINFLDTLIDKTYFHSFWIQSYRFWENANIFNALAFIKINKKYLSER